MRYRIVINIQPLVGFFRDLTLEVTPDVPNLDDLIDYVIFITDHEFNGSQLHLDFLLSRLNQYKKDNFFCLDGLAIQLLQ